MPTHLFSGVLHLDYKNAVKADTEKQNYTVCPRYWYIDATFRCEACTESFVWTTGEQKVWFEDYYFWIDSTPRHCRKCQTQRRHLAALRKTYDQGVASAADHGSIEEKQRIVDIVSELESAFTTLPKKMLETQALFERQIEKTRRRSQDSA